MTRNILHLAVHLQAGYAACAYGEIPAQINQFAFCLHQRGIYTIWGAGAECAYPLFPASESAGIRLFSRDQQLISEPNEGDMVCLNVGGNVFSNPYLKEHLAVLHNPLIAVTGIFTSFCVTKTVLDLIRNGYECYVPLDLTSDSDLDTDNAPYKSAVFLAYNQTCLLEATKSFDLNKLHLGSAQHFIDTFVDKKRAAPVRSRPLISDELN